MIIEKLVLNNFRVFAGQVELNLSPSNEQDKNLPVVLFGGLNGAGKTSILTGVRLAIFGKRAFGQNISLKEYKNILGELTHKSKNGLSGDDSSVEVVFTYVKQGETFEYRVRRSWLHSVAEEELLIYENGFALTELTNEQAQSFLFDLIPIGVADLFFFDGEKIKELAEEDDNRILADALKKMIGVDFVERGIADLSIILRSKNKEFAGKELQENIINLESDLEHLEKEIEGHNCAIDQLLVELTSEEKDLERMRLKLQEEGGEWVVSRDDLIRRQSELEYKKKQLSIACQEEFKANFAFTVAPNFMTRLFEEVKTSRQDTQAQYFNNKLLSKQNLINKHLDGAVNSEKIIDLIESLSEALTGSQLEFVSPRTVEKFQQIQTTQVRDKNALKNLLIEIEKIESELDELGKNIARVPDQDALAQYFLEMNEQEIKVDRIQVKLSSVKERCSTKINEAIEITKILERLGSKVRIDGKDLLVVKYAELAIKAMQDLTVRLTKIKVLEIQNYFYDSFKRMARKDDMDLSIKIEPSNFNVELIADNGQLIDKKRLSAGEKQIYALAILEALGKASGRKLPFIIDTPLGRLDSKHRQKIVKEFFPKVNDQVIILSTDTEVDEAFFRDLEPHISKSYELKYDSSSGSSSVLSGYFWRG